MSATRGALLRAQLCVVPRGLPPADIRGPETSSSGSHGPARIREQALRSKAAEVRENARRDIRMDNQKRELADNESITRLGQQIARIGVQGKRRKEKMDNNLAILDDLN